MRMDRCEKSRWSAVLLGIVLLCLPSIGAADVRTSRHGHFQTVSHETPQWADSVVVDVASTYQVPPVCCQEVSQGIWYRPRYEGLRKKQRCSPDPFHPRGLGHLFATPSTPCRIDYAPSRLRTLDASYGPFYFRRAASQYCEHCECCGLCKHECLLGNGR